MQLSTETQTGFVYHGKRVKMSVWGGEFSTQRSSSTQASMEASPPADSV